MTENKLMKLQLFLFGHLAQPRATFPLQMTNNLVLDLWVVCMTMLMNSVTLNLTLRCQSCMYPGLKHCRGKRALYINHLVLKCLFGREPAQEMR